MPKANPSTQDAAKAAIAAKLDTVAADKEAATAHARWLTGSALDMARPLPDEMANAVAELVSESLQIAADKRTIKENEDGICNEITKHFFEHVAHGGDPAQLNMDVCLHFSWPLKTFMVCGKEINISGTNKKPATFGQVMSKIAKVWAVDGTIPRLYTSKDKALMTVRRRYDAILKGEVTPMQHCEKPQKAVAKAVNTYGSKLTLPEMKALRYEQKRLLDQMDENIRLAEGIENKKK